MKKFITALICVFSACLFTAFGLITAGCSGCGGESVGQMPGGKTSDISFDSESLTVVVGEERAVVVEYDFKVGKTVTWTSANEAVAKVDDGVVTGVRPGKTKIKAEYDGAEAELTVKVVTDGIVPVLCFEGGYENGETINVVKNGSFDFGAYVSFNGKNYKDGEFSYEVSDGAVGRVENGTFIAGSDKKSASVKISASWRGIESPELVACFTVKVISDNSILIEGGAVSGISLYTLQAFSGRTYPVSYVLSDVTALSDGTDVSDTLAYEIRDNIAADGSGDAISFNESTKEIKAIKYGGAKLAVTSVTSDGVFEKVFDISVARPLATAEEKVPLFSMVDGVIDNLNDVFGKNVTLKDAYQGEKPLTVTDNKIFGIKVDDPRRMNEVSVTVYDDVCGYELTLETYTKVIKTAQDFLAFDIQNETDLKDGLYYLANDITVKEAVTFEHRGYHPNTGEYKGVKNTAAWNYADAGFKGIFDGNGHKVTLHVKSGAGIFGIMHAGAAVKNVAFYDVTIEDYRPLEYVKTDGTVGALSSAEKCAQKEASLFGTYTRANAGTEYSDLYVNVTKIVKNYEDGIVSGFISKLNYSDRLKNVIIDFDADVKTLTGDFGALVSNNLFGSEAWNYVDKIFTDTAIVSFAPIYQTVGEKETVKIYGANGKTTESGAVIYNVKNFLQYDNYACLKEDAQRDSSAGKKFVAAFSTSWNVSEYGVPVFKGITPSATPELSKTAVDLTLGFSDGDVITVFCGSTSDAVWSSSAPGVIKVENGKITALTKGSAKITCSVGGKTATVSVTADWKDGVSPKIGVEGVAGGTYYADCGENIVFVPYLIYGGEEITEGVSFVFSDVKNATGGNIVFDKNTGTFVAPQTAAKGEITVNCTYYGVVLTELRFNVSVFKAFEFTVNGEALTEGDEINIYTVNEFDGVDYETEAPFSVNATGVTLKEIKVLNEEFASYSDAAEKITANPKAGATKIEIVFTDGTFETSRFVNLNVLRPDPMNKEEELWFSVENGRFYGLSEAFETMPVFTGGKTQDKKAFSVTGSEAQGFTPVNGENGQRESVTFYTDSVAYVFGVKSATKVLTEINDLKIFQANKGGMQKTGYYYVYNDIIYDPAFVPNSVGGEQSNMDQFAGVFDGGGHKIEYSIQQSGLFGYITGATIKNAAFVIKDYYLDRAGVRVRDIATYAGYAAFASVVNGSANFENIYVKYDMPSGFKFDLTYCNGQSSGLSLVERSYGKPVFKNVVVDMSSVEIETPAANHYNYAYGALIARATSAMITDATVDNVYLVSSAVKFFSYQSNYNGYSSDNVLNTVNNFTVSKEDAELFNSIAVKAAGNLSSCYKTLLNGAHRFDGYTLLKNYFAANPAALAAFTGAWDTSLGIPVISSMKDEFFACAAEIEIDGERKDDAVVYYGVPSEIVVEANSLGTALSVSLERVSGGEFLTFDGGKAIYDGTAAEGSETVKATITVGGLIVEKTFTVTVFASSAIQLKIDGKERDYAAFVTGVEGEIDITASFLGNNLSLTLDKYDGDDLLTFNGSKAVYNGAGVIGTERIKVSVELNGKTIEKIVTVNVLPQALEENAVLSKATGKLTSLPSVFGVGTILKVTSESETLFENGVWSDIKTSVITSDNHKTLTPTKLVVTAYLSDGSVYRFNLVVYDMVIETAADFASLDGKVLTGYYVVANDIALDTSAFNGFEKTPVLGEEKDGVKCGFILDGNGHTMELPVTANALFDAYGVGSYGTGTAGKGNATIRNIAFIFKTKLADNSVGTVLSGTAPGAYGQQTNIENVYVRYETAVYASGANKGSSTFGDGVGNGFYTYMKNVVIDDAIGAFPSVKTNYGVLFNNDFRNNSADTRPEADADGRLYRKDLNDYVNVLVISRAPLSYNGSDKMNFATNDTAGYDASVVANKNLYRTSVYRADTVDGIKEIINENSLLDAFTSSVWDTETFGMPVFKTDKGFAVNKAQTSVDGEVKSEAAFVQSESGSVTVALDIAGIKVTAVTVTHLSGENLVTINGGTVSYVAGGEVGVETLSVTATFNGVAVKAEVKVTVNYIAKEGEIMLSTADIATEGKKIYLPKSLDGLDIIKITDVVSGDVYFENGTYNYDVMPKNAGTTVNYAYGEKYENEISTYNTKTAYERTLIVTLASGEKYSVAFAAYTKVLSAAADLKSLASTRDNTLGSRNVFGYYVVANDIEYDETVVNSIASMTNNQTIFSGVFDGNGYTISYKAGVSGLFGYLGEGAVIKNAAFDIKAFASPKSIGGLSAFASGVMGGTTVDTVTVKFPVIQANVSLNSWGQSTGLGLFQSVDVFSLKLKNVIADMSGVTIVTADETSAGAYGKAGVKNAYGVITAHKQSYVRPENVNGLYVISSDEYIGYEANRLSSSGNQIEGYSSYQVLDEAFCLLFAAEDAELYEAATITDPKAAPVHVWAAKSATAGTAGKVLLSGAHRFETTDGLKTYFAANADKLEPFGKIFDVSGGMPAL